MTSIVSEVDDPNPAAEELADEEAPLFTSSSCERGGVGGESTTIREDEETDREVDDVVVAEEEDVVAVNDDELRWTIVVGPGEVVEEIKECVTVVLDEAERSGVGGAVMSGMGRVQPSLLQISTMMESHSPYKDDEETKHAVAVRVRRVVDRYLEEVVELVGFAHELSVDQDLWYFRVGIAHFLCRAVHEHTRISPFIYDAASDWS